MMTLNAIEIVYPASAENERIAGRLKKELQSYRIPKAIQRKTGYRSLEEVERPALIVLCNPESVNDPGVDAAIARFSDSGNYRRIIALVTAGKSGNRFPERLLYEELPDGTRKPREPLAANIAAPSYRQMMRKLETEKLRIIASILGVAFDDLRNRRRRQRVQVAAAAGTVVFAAALAFLAYALTRVRIISGQQDELTIQYEAAQAAEQEAEIQRTEARKAFAGTIAEKAREVLGYGDSELALLLCTEMLPERRDVEELTGVLHDSLAVLCGEGYVPVTTETAYTLSRYGVPPRELYTHDPGPDPEEDKFSHYLYPPIPEGYETEYAYAELSRIAMSVEQGCGVYRGYFKTPGDKSVGLIRVHFPETPEKDYYVKDRNGEYLYFTSASIFPDGTILGMRSEGGPYYRVALESGEILPFFDDEPEADPAGSAAAENAAAEDLAAGGTAEITAAEAADTEKQAAVISTDESGGVKLPHKIKEFRCFSGMDVAFGFSVDAVEVYGLSPFRYLETLEGISALEEQKGVDYLFGVVNDENVVKVFTRTPFAEYRSFGPVDSHMSGAPEAVRLADGREILEYRGCFFDLSDGTVLRSFKRGDLGGLTGIESDMSSEGWVPMKMRDDVVFVSEGSAEAHGSIPYLYINARNGFYGPYDEERHRRSASAYHMGGLVWEYRGSAREVPEDLEGQLALAEEFLQGRTLTERERKTYLLD